MNILITGGLGFIGMNTAIHFAKDVSNSVFIFDNMSKPGSIKNFDTAKDFANDIIVGDVRNYNDIKKVCLKYKYDVIFHFAAQTAVTLSVTDPVNDFETNVVGSFNLLEAVRKYQPDAHVIYSSTNKVYGALSDIKLVHQFNRYQFASVLGINEQQPLDFYSPYGCSKGAADQYFRDYARSYNLKTTVVRQSCIYGRYQNGTEDQGWVAWFVKAFIHGIPITVYGDGKQVRDILYADDLVYFFEHLVCCKKYGQVFNIGGGISNSISLLELITSLKLRFTNHPEIKFDKWRIGDQKIFISDNKKAQMLGWTPKTDVASGIERLIDYMKEEKI